ncbi:MAG: hypothetical protein IPN01_04585 [Deltaproteobacteria bacterium]|nr:hypothetical protein [Deltaproteobacteria bacterium]
MPPLSRLAPLIPLITLVMACAEPPAPRDSGPSNDDTSAEADPWPDPAELPDAELSVVSEDGALLLSGATITVETAAAGLDSPRWVTLTLTNRGDEALALSDAGAWLSGEGFTWATPPPDTLPPAQSARVSLTVNGLGATQETEWRGALTIPGLSAPFALGLVATMPRPLRLVVAIEGGGTLTSDDYGATWAELPPFEGAQEAQRGTLTWGNGRFLRTFADGGDWTDPGVYATSELGEDWTISLASDEFWPSECAYGLGLFACARSDALSWSATGGAIVHEQTAWRDMLIGLIFDGEQFVGVGRAGRIVTSDDGLAWDTEVNYEEEDYLYDVAYGDGLWVAVGGNNRQIVLVQRRPLRHLDSPGAHRRELLRPVQRRVQRRRLAHLWQRRQRPDLVVLCGRHDLEHGHHALLDHLRAPRRRRRLVLLDGEPPRGRRRAVPQPRRAELGDGPHPGRWPRPARLRGGGPMTRASPFFFSCSSRSLAACEGRTPRRRTASTPPVATASKTASLTTASATPPPTARRRVRPGSRRPSTGSPPPRSPLARPRPEATRSRSPSPCTTAVMSACACSATPMSG